MSTNTKPRICEVLGVEVGERFRLVDREAGYDSVELTANEAGDVVSTECTAKLPPAILAIYAINHPESIIRQPRFTEDEVADAKAMRRMFPEVVTLSRGCDGHLICGNKYRMVQLVLQPDAKAFPSIRPGQSVTIADIIKNEKEK